MMGVRVHGFDWDTGNRQKCQQHGVSLTEIEALFKADPATFPDPVHSESETRFRAIGTVNERYIFVVFTLRSFAGKTLIRPISARYMHEREVRHYEAQKDT